MALLLLAGAGLLMRRKHLIGLRFRRFPPGEGPDCAGVAAATQHPEERSVFPAHGAGDVVPECAGSLASTRPGGARPASCRRYPSPARARRAFPIEGATSRRPRCRRARPLRRAPGISARWGSTWYAAGSRRSRRSAPRTWPSPSRWPGGCSPDRTQSASASGRAAALHGPVARDCRHRARRRDRGAAAASAAPEFYRSSMQASPALLRHRRPRRANPRPGARPFEPRCWPSIRDLPVFEVRTLDEIDRRLAGFAPLHDVADWRVRVRGGLPRPGRRLCDSRVRRRATDATKSAFVWRSAPIAAPSPGWCWGGRHVSSAPASRWFAAIGPTTRLIGGLLGRRGPTDPITYAGVVLLLAVAGFVAALAPARRAMRTDPVLALRSE